MTSAVDPPFDQLLATAEAVARERPEVDLELAHAPGPCWTVPGDLHDPETVSGAYLVAAAILQL